MFDAQRTAIKQGQQAFKQGLAVQRSAGRMALTGLKGQESLQRQGLELAQAATHGYMGASAAVLGSEEPPEQRQTIDETFARLKETHSQFFDAVERELNRGVESFDELSDDYVDALDEQLDQLLESQQTIEDQTTRNFDEFSQQLREQLERTQEMQDQLEDRFEQQTEQAEQLLRRQTEQAEQFQRQLEEDAERMQRQLRSQAGASQGRRAGGERQAGGDQQAATERELEDIDGLGSTYVQRLQEAGITSVDDLARSDAETLAEAADVSENRAQDWIDQASA